MAAPTPATVGGKITAALFNQFVTRLSGAQTYTPTITNWNSATTPPTTTGRYWQTGDIVHVLVTSKLGTGSITVGNISVSLPVACDTTGMLLDSTNLNGAFSAKDVSSGDTYAGIVRLVDANTIRLMRFQSSTPGQVNPTSSGTPFTWATLDEISVLVSYPIA